ncbi:hypothetical protein OROMI_002124 [Orobanche minor]
MLIVVLGISSTFKMDERFGIGATYMRCPNMIGQCGGR